MGAGGLVTWKKVLLRTLKVGAHEAGHMFSLHHCIAFECLMNGGNNLKGGWTTRRRR